MWIFNFFSFWKKNRCIAAVSRDERRKWNILIAGKLFNKHFKYVTCAISNEHAFEYSVWLMNEITKNFYL